MALAQDGNSPSPDAKTHVTKKLSIAARSLFTYGRCWENDAYVQGKEKIFLSRISSGGKCRWKLFCSVLTLRDA
jgi:hypothetical protein